VLRICDPLSDTPEYETLRANWIVMADSNSSDEDWSAASKKNTILLQNMVEQARELIASNNKEKSQQ